jgi:hypothetical protein
LTQIKYYFMRKNPRLNLPHEMTFWCCNCKYQSPKESMVVWIPYATTNFHSAHQDASTSGGMNHGVDGIMGLRFAGATGGRSRRPAAWLSGPSNLKIDYNQILLSIN